MAFVSQQSLSMNCIHTDAERLQRIGEILARGIAGHLSTVRTNRICPEYGAKESEMGQNLAWELSEELREVVSFILQFQHVSPGEIRRKFAFSRATAYRRLRELEDRGLIRRAGNSRNVRYAVAK